MPSPTGTRCAYEASNLALADAAHAQPVGLGVFFGSVCVDGRPAISAEPLRAPVSTVAHLEVDLRCAADQAKVFRSRGNRDSVCRSCETLAVRAVANRDALGVDDGFIGDCATVAGTVHLHGIARHGFGSPLALRRTCEDGLEVLEADGRRRVLMHDSKDMPGLAKHPRDPVLHGAKLLALCGL
jgi:hypothetical protein